MGPGFLIGSTLESNLGLNSESKSFNWTKSRSDDPWLLTLWLFSAGALNCGGEEAILGREDVRNSKGSKRREENDLSWARQSEIVTQNASFCNLRKCLDPVLKCTTIYREQHPDSRVELIISWHQGGGSCTQARWVSTEATDVKLWAGQRGTKDDLVRILTNFKLPLHWHCVVLTIVRWK